MSYDSPFGPVGPKLPGPVAQRRTPSVSQEAGGRAAKAPAAPAPVPVPVQPAAAPAAESRSLSEITEALRKVNLTFDLFEITAQFEVSDAGDVIVRIVNEKTGELIRRIPSEELQRFIESLPDGKGALTDKLA